MEDEFKKIKDDTLESLPAELTQDEIIATLNAINSKFLEYLDEWKLESGNELDDL